MSQQSLHSRKGSSPRGRKGYNSPKRAQVEPSKLLYAPRPFSRADSVKTVQKPEFNANSKSQTLPHKKINKKPAVPPKPRNVVVKQKSSTKLQKRTIVEDKNDQNDSGLSGEFLENSTFL